MPVTATAPAPPLPRDAGPLPRDAGRLPRDAGRLPRDAGRLPLEALIGAEGAVTPSALDVSPALRAVQPRPAAADRTDAEVLELPDDAAWERRERRRMVLAAAGAAVAAAGATGLSLITAFG